MNEPITFTLGQVTTGFLAVCAGITCICLAVSWLIKAWYAFKKPGIDKEKKIHERFEHVETRVDNLSNDFEIEKKRIDDFAEEYKKTTRQHDEAIAWLAEGQKLILEVQRTSIDIELNGGTDTSKLHEMDTKIDRYLANALYSRLEREV